MTLIMLVQALIDPVCLMTCFPDLLHNFVYRAPRWDNVFSHIGFMDILRFICSRDLLIAEVCSSSMQRQCMHRESTCIDELPLSSASTIQVTGAHSYDICNL